MQIGHQPDPSTGLTLRHCPCLANVGNYWTNAWALPISTKSFSDKLLAITGLMIGHCPSLSNSSLTSCWQLLDHHLGTAHLYQIQLWQVVGNYWTNTSSLPISTNFFSDKLLAITGPTLRHCPSLPNSTLASCWQLLD
ncbi:hypothetical protein J6590_049557 [Homalodisca vitripennis]|nr:hypothetical protein J6590_049557 [Homalodisca vitripennis]